MIKASEVFENYNQVAEIEKCINEIEMLILDAAKAGKTSIRFRNFNFGGSHLYGGKPTEFQADVITKLGEAGYKAQIHCEERSFVDIWLEIDWKVV